MDFYFKPAITWSKISSGSIAFRYKPQGHVFDVAGTSIFADEENFLYLHGFCNSKVALTIAKMLSPTLNYEVGHIASFPVITSDKKHDLSLCPTSNNQNSMRPIQILLFSKYHNAFNAQCPNTLYCLLPNPHSPSSQSLTDSPPSIHLARVHQGSSEKQQAAQTV